MGLPEQHAVAVDGVARDGAVGVVRRVPGERDARVGDRDRVHVAGRVRRQRCRCTARVRAWATGEARETWPAPSTARTRSVNVVAQGEALGGQRRGGAAGEHLAGAGEELVARDAPVVLRGAEHDA